MGENFVRQGILNTREDIFFLTFTELNSTETGGFQANVNRRRAALEANRDISVPSIIFGEEALPVDDDIGDVLEGYATSRGQYCGPVRIVWGMRDFDRVKEGDVLAVPFTDIGWSPLFNKAGAVIAESGGLLSHSSILAREHGIPCIVSIPNVCQLKDGVLVTVDGYKGRVTVHADAEEHAQQECRP
jgi:pyruvate,water dikinase